MKRNILSALLAFFVSAALTVAQKNVLCPVCEGEGFLESLAEDARAGKASPVSSSQTHLRSDGAVVLDFEGIGDLQLIEDFYGPDYLFSSQAMALVDSDAGGVGNFANEPSPNTILFWLGGSSAVLNVPNGFENGFSFFYSSSVISSVRIYSEVNRGGDLLATVPLQAQHTSGCVGDPNGLFCNWSPVGVEFEGIGKSIDFSGTSNQFGIDQITFGSSLPGGGPG